jgi:hypothetical protein
MEEAPENGKESSHSAHTNGMMYNDMQVKLLLPHKVFAYMCIACGSYRLRSGEIPHFLASEEKYKPSTH